MRKLTCSPDAEVIGLLLNSYVDNMMGEETAPVFKQNGLVGLDPHGWHPLIAMMNALNELAALPSVSLNLTAIGMRIGETVPMPPELGEHPTLEQVLGVWDGAYQFLHRGADVGKIWIEKVGNTHFKTFHSVVYPDDMSYGVLYGYGRRFLPRGTHFTVHYDEKIPARDYGGTADYTLIHIEW
ncbi:MAG: hypothetical protein BroJett018_25710 [Chloroflexota bacterium]|nr:MAG: hypothetical protein BroJett018_25710 [Chloroflexota bacterium]